MLYMCYTKEGENDIMKHFTWKILFVLTVAFVLFGCQKMNQFTPQEVIKNVLVSEDDISYYGEVEYIITEKGEEQLNMFIKEWRHNEKQRLEIDNEGENIVTIKDGIDMIIYDENEQSAYTMDHLEMEQLYINPREELDMLLDMIKDTHDIEIVGDTQLLGRKAFHLVANPKEGSNSLFGEQELWIDKEYWMVLKMKSMSGDNASHLTYKDIQFHPKMEDAIFQLDLPEGITIENLDDQASQEEITLKELPSKMGLDILYIPNEKEHEIGTITYTEATDEPFGYKEITIDYKQQGLPLMTLTIFNLADEEILDEGMNDNKDALDELDDYAENVQKETIRRKKGYYFELDSLRSISWDEDDFSYSIDIIDPNVTIDEVLEWTEKMEHP